MLAGSPDASGTARAMWTCSKCGAGQLLELTVTKDTRRGDLRKIIGGMAFAANPDRGYAFIREGMPDEIRS